MGPLLFGDWATQSSSKNSFARVVSTRFCCPGQPGSAARSVHRESRDICPARRHPVATSAATSPSTVRSLVRRSTIRATTRGWQSLLWVGGRAGARAVVRSCGRPDWCCSFVAAWLQSPCRRGRALACRMTLTRLPGRGSLGTWGGSPTPSCATPQGASSRRASSTERSDRRRRFLRESR